MHVSYLNSAYQQKQLDFWRQERVLEPGCWEGTDGYTYIGRHLGYRFVVREAKMARGKLQIRIENTGFAALCEPADCLLILEKEDGSQLLHPFSADARRWESGSDTLLSVKLPQTEEWVKGGSLFLQLKRRDGAGSILFANQGAGEGLLLGRLG